jgi:uncharacterized SAM-binding protein YcdF (DUF218 family)
MLAAVVTWFVGLALFVYSIPSTTTANDTSTDAIIVLTGGPKRVARGFDLLGRDKAHTLFISGVGKDTTLNDLLDKYGNDAVREKVKQGVARVVLDYRADSTFRNAHEAAQFIREKNLIVVRLVTANYHMPRSLLEFEGVLPRLVIIPDPVLTDSFHPTQWWQDNVSRQMILLEYHKWLAVWFRTRVFAP